jgi:hypothetical protein
MQLAHSAITLATSKLLFVQMQLTSTASSPSVWRMRSFLLSLSVSTPSVLMSHALVSSTMGWQIVEQAEGTSVASSSCARLAGMTAARVARRTAERIFAKLGR